jgi:hypothetical protein
VEARHDDHVASDNAVEHSIGEPPDVSAPGIAVDNTVAERSIEEDVNHLPHCIQELVAQTGTLRLVP